MANVAIIRTATPQLGRISGVIDGITALKYQFGTAIGEEPLEDGVETHDHATALPVSILATGQVGTLDGGHRPLEAMETLREMHDAKEVFRGVTEHGVFNEMIIRRFEANQDGPIRGLLFRMELFILRRRGVTDTSLSADLVSGAASDRTEEILRGSTPLSGIIVPANPTPLIRTLDAQIVTSDEEVVELNEEYIEIRTDADSIPDLGARELVIMSLTSERTQLNSLRASSGRLVRQIGSLLLDLPIPRSRWGGIIIQLARIRRSYNNLQTSISQSESRLNFQRDRIDKALS